MRSLRTSAVTVVVPVYNAGKLIYKLVDSLQKQTYQNWELILVNDGSIDDSEVICRKVCRIDSRIKYIFQQNKGPLAARVNGINHASNDILMFMDADDTFQLNALGIVIKKMMQYNADIVMFDCGEQVPNTFVPSIAERFDTDEFFQSRNQLYSKVCFTPFSWGSM